MKTGLSCLAIVVENIVVTVLIVEVVSIPAGGWLQLPALAGQIAVNIIAARRLKGPTQPVLSVAFGIGAAVPVLVLFHYCWVMLLAG